jgi:4-alpha-glucanotransferase
MSTAISQLAQRLGILPGYHRIDGSYWPCELDSALACLRAMGYPVDGERAAVAAIAGLDAAEAARRLPHELLVNAGEIGPGQWPAGRIALESGAWLDFAGGNLPALPIGVHKLIAGEDCALVLASPMEAPGVRERLGGAAGWGLYGALYGLRSATNPGVGDYADLAELVTALGGLGAAFFGINPVHAQGAVGGGSSPYSPSSRSAFDVRHIALGAVPEVAASPAALALIAQHEDSLAAARAAPLVDYTVRDAVVLPALRAAYATAALAGDSERGRAFAGWRERQSSGRQRQAVFDAISELHGPDWRSWPQPLQCPDDPAVAALAQTLADSVRFHQWCQWLAEGQLAEAQRCARAGGMALGLYLDIAVGVRPGGAETWSARDAFAVGVSLGAPPDALSAEGQAWGLAPFSPAGLRRRHYQPFREMLQATMAHAGMVRIDHVIGFARSFWVPEEGTAGAYVSYPMDVLLALTRIEAHRAGALVVGEDLGTVPEGLRETLSGAGILGCSIMPFERWGHEFAPPSSYRVRSLAAFGTHDLPSLVCWWRGGDILQRHAAGALTDAECAWEMGIRSGDRSALCRALAAAQKLPAGIDVEHPPQDCSEPLRLAIHALLAGSSAELVAVSLDDALGLDLQQNVPGTTWQQPNWRHRLPDEVAALADHPRLRALVNCLAAARSAD